MFEDKKDWYNPNKDIQEVDQFGYIDLPEAFANNSVPTVVGPEDNLLYNNMEDPSAAMDMPKDIFEVMHQNKTVHDYKDPENNPE